MTLETKEGWKQFVKRCKEQLIIATHNLKGMGYAKDDELILSLNKDNVDICAVQETKR